jgi:glycerophosphoryl diester phosphodiesterase
MTVLIAAHRGACRQESQNSIAAFDAAKDLGADMIEYDVRRTGDGVYIVAHDETWQGELISDMRYSDLRDAPVLQRQGRITGGKKPERAEDVMKRYKGAMLQDIEVKEAGTGLEVVEMALRHLDVTDFVVTSFHDQVIADIKQRYPQVKAGLLVNAPGRIFERAQAVNADYLCPRETLCTRRVTARAVRLGMPLMVWTVNRDARISRFVDDPAVHTVITDVPGRALQIRDHGLGS